MTDARPVDLSALTDLRTPWCIHGRGVHEGQLSHEKMTECFRSVQVLGCAMESESRVGLCSRA